MQSSADSEYGVEKLANQPREMKNFGCGANLCNELAERYYKDVQYISEIFITNRRDLKKHAVCREKLMRLCQDDLGNSKR